MKLTLEKLWNEYFAEECAAMDTEEQRALARQVTELHKEASALLTEEQIAVTEKHTALLCELQETFVKSAFFKGCRFACAFLLALESTKEL